MSKRAHVHASRPAIRGRGIVALSIAVLFAGLHAACAEGSGPSIDDQQGDTGLVVARDSRPSVTEIGNGPESSVEGGGETGSLCVGSVTFCGLSCVDLAKDPANCGACAKACAKGEVCSAGKCASSCGAGTTSCGELCIDLTKDGANCGACGKACGPGEVCSASVCSLVCGGGTTKCGTSCVDLTKDPTNCGGCGTVCAAGEACIASKCEIVCAGGTTKCGTVCVDTAKDPTNCGGCGTTCKAGDVCTAGKCELVCGGGTTKCAGTCVTTANDPLNCGSCGVVCGSGPKSTAYCAAGACGLTCAAGFGNCNGIASDGCESDLASDPSNCGGCGKPCAAGSICTAGACVSTATTVTFPSTVSTTYNSYFGTTSPLGSGGGAVHYISGDYVEEKFTRASAATKLDLNFKMSDYTSSYCSVGYLFWNVTVNGVTVGSYSWLGGYGGDETIVKSFTFGAVAPVSGQFAIRLQETNTVCPGAGSWNWYAGGTATLQ